MIIEHKKQMCLFYSKHIQRTNLVTRDAPMMVLLFNSVIYFQFPLLSAMGRNLCQVGSKTYTEKKL